MAITSLLSGGNTVSPASLINFNICLYLISWRGLLNQDPKTFCRDDAKASQSAKRCHVVCVYSSSPASHCCGIWDKHRSQYGGSNSSTCSSPRLTRSLSTKKLCLFQKLWPVMISISSLSERLPSVSNHADISGLTSGNHILVCLHVFSICHL